MHWKQILRRAGIWFLSVIAALAIFVQVQQYLLRWRAERLLADIRAIHTGKSTWGDAQRLMHKWGTWGEWVGSCTAEYCEYQIVLEDQSHAYPSFIWTETSREKRSPGHIYRRWQLNLYSILGGRVAQVYAYFRIKRGTIWAKSYLVQMPRHPFEEGLDDLLIGDAAGQTNFTPFGDWPGLDLHPGYSIRAAGPCDGCRDGACTICELIRTRVTPSASPEITDQLFEFDLSCISSWRYCSEPAEMMPLAWRLYVREKKALEKAVLPSLRNWNDCHINLELAGRDYKYVLLTDVVSINTSFDSGFTRYAVSLRPAKSLKNRATTNPSLLNQPLIGSSDAILPGGIRMADLKPGSQVIFLFERDEGFADAVPQGPDPCSCVPDNDRNRAAIERGITLDGESEKN